MSKFRLIDIYILKRISMPLLGAASIAMAALLMERLIRLMDMLANRGSPLSLVLKILANLVPHYLAIAIPAAFFIGVLYACLRLSADSEFDAMRASGLSLFRIAKPIIALAVMLTIFSAYLLGFLQPYTRYAYRALVYLVTETSWSSAIERGAFFTGFGGKTILIKDISKGGRQLSQIFINEKSANGTDITTTSTTGNITADPGNFSLLLTLTNGIRLEAPNVGYDNHAVSFNEMAIPLEVVVPAPFHARGEKESELTFIELLKAYFHPVSGLQKSDIVAEINHQLVRSASIFFLPILAMPFGITSHRSSRSARLLSGILLLIVYYQVIEFGQTLVEERHISAFLALWVPFLVFSVGSTLLFFFANTRPGHDPLAYVLNPLESAAAHVMKLKKLLPWGTA